MLYQGFAWRTYKFLMVSIERPPPDLNARLFRHGYLFSQNLGTDTFYIHRTHPRARSLAANASFVQQPAKCRNHETVYLDRPKLKDVRCHSVFGCCAFPGYPEGTTRYVLPA